MRKILINIVLILSMIIPCKVYALSTADANEGIDLTKDINLTLNYNYDNYDFNNINVKIYYIASVTSDFRYQLSSDFSSYPIKINGIKTDNEWTSLEQTLNAYITADDIEETLSEKIRNNKITINNLKAGLYFIKTDKIYTDDYTLLFDEFLLHIPDLNEDGTWNYDVNVYPKAEEYIPKYEIVNYTVIKEWVDDSKNRPQSIEIEIYEDDILVDTQVLSKDNNWTYKWETEDDGSKWTVVERNIPEGYNVTITNNNRNFIIINTDPDYEEMPPQTGDNINLYFYLLFSSIIGFVLLIVSLIIQNKKVNEN